ncbi:MAG: LysE family transporter [Desulfobacterales bacterium]|nr:LysE family transporter [Desulfobacterales bacterium]
MIAFLSAGMALGLYAGFFPGPLLTLVISQTLKHGPKEGVKVAFAPIITDFPILLVSTTLLMRLSDYKMILGVVSILGALFLVYLAYGSIKTRGVEVNMDQGVPYSFIKGAVVNALSPNPYLFWITIGAPTIIKGFAESYIAPLLFVGSFFASLVGSKCLLAVIAGKSKHFLTGRAYLYIMRALGIVLLAFAFVLFKDGLRLLK